jgi:hypothetical protein
MRHEALVEMFRQHPEFAAMLLHDEFGVDLPAYRRASLPSADLTEAAPTELRPDAIVTFAADGDPDKPVLAVVVEVQLGRDLDKHWSWPLYLAKLRARMHCPVVLLVLTVDSTTARWCSGGIELGHPGWVLRPLVYGPERVPVVTDPAQVAGVPELALLSAMVHGDGPDGVKIVDALVASFATTDRDRAILYSELAFEVLPKKLRGLWEERMSTHTFTFQSDYARRLKAEGRAEGRAEGEATAVLDVLDTRGFDVSEEVRARITSCSDLDQLKTWLRRAVTVGTIDELFE